MQDDALKAFNACAPVSPDPLLFPSAAEEVTVRAYDEDGGYVLRFKTETDYRAAIDTMRASKPRDRYIACPRAFIVVHVLAEHTGPALWQAAQKTMDRLCPP